MLSLEFLQFCSISKKRFMTCESQLWALRQFWGGRHSPHKSLTGLIHSWGRRINQTYMMSADNAGGERFLCVNPLCTVPPHSALWSEPPGPTRSKNTRKIFLNFSSLLSRGYAMGPELFNAEETTGLRTMCQNAKIIATMAKPRFTATGNTLLEVLVWKRVRRSQPPRQEVGLLSRKERGTTSSWKKSLEFLRGAEDIPIPATAPNWNTAPSWLACLPALLHLLSHSRGAEHAQRSRVIVPPSQMCPKNSALHFYARSWRRCPDRK